VGTNREGSWALRCDLFSRTCAPNRPAPDAPPHLVLDVLAGGAHRHLDRPAERATYSNLARVSHVIQRALYLIPAFRPENRKVLYLFIGLSLLMFAVAGSCLSMQNAINRMPQ